MPLELFAFGLSSTLARLGDEVAVRDVPASPDGGAIADYRGPIGDPAALAARFDADPGIAAHGLFPPAMVSELFIGRGESAERSTIGRWMDLVEREREMNALTALLDALVEGQPRMALIEGPAGIGKTRLLAELRAGGGRGAACARSAPAARSSSASSRSGSSARCSSRR